MMNYSIEPNGDAYMLTVWEPAPITTDRAKPFVFKANYMISSPLEAFGLLKLIKGGRRAVRSGIPDQLARAAVST